MNMNRKGLLAGIAFAAPATILFSVFVAYPFLQSIYYSFTQWDSIRPPVYTGLENYKELFKDSKMIQAFNNTLKMTIFGIVVQNPLALLLAVLLNRKFRTKAFLRTVFYMPVVVSLVVTSVVWGNILQYDGLVNYLLTQLGLESAVMDWLGNINTVFPTIILLTQWQALGYCAVIYLAGLQSIPQELYEASTIDGASGFRQFRYITFPLLMPVVTIVLFLTIVGGLKLFDLPYVMTNGGPGSASYTMTLAIYVAAFGNNTYGYATAAGIVLMIFIMIVTFLQLHFTRKQEVEA
ncbi:carbohydrate ABC transporter permease [Paenibacillus montanisoli]|uniref:Sugar ABC transporter permease n=1 Tax=Paenibacillus montanisoli TaxID=2081970 RepID=A0A328U2U3_9BACL|nr:sugar ABC transporter permease [Paenibacillus montanisoli]RAP76959.1 sugar ABC transporter permease [Paenibacillus montanisoli]